MNPQDQTPPQFQSNLPQNHEDSPYTRVSNDLSVMQPDEVVICEIKRHPIGIIGIYVAIVFILTIIAVLTFVLLPAVISEATQIGVAVFLILTVISMIYALIATKVYWGNSWIVTSDSITQIDQINLFSRQSSQLALSNIEDVAAEQHGLLTHIFNYGVIKAETAGHHGKFVFLYCPNPNYHAQKILAAREALGPSGHHGHVV
jgi:hypothetical protein